MVHLKTRLLLAVALVSGLQLSALAQDQWPWSEKPKNLQVLPEDWAGSKLRPIMRGFTRSLGVRCTYCHVGDEAKPFNTFDFVSDANPNKERAREMYRMLGSINDHLDKIKPSGDPRVNMWCHTCHDGRPRPFTLGEELDQKYKSKGIESAVAHYQDLKTRFYGKSSYDFSERSLNDFGFELLEKDAAGAIRIFALNTEQYPKSPNTWDSLAEGYLKAGDKSTAEQYYKKVLELEPGNENAREMLARIRDMK